MSYLNEKSINVIHSLDDANSQVDRQDVYSIKQIDQVAGGNKYENTKGHVLNSNSLEAKTRVVHAEQERKVAAD